MFLRMLILAPVCMCCLQAAAPGAPRKPEVWLGHNRPEPLTMPGAKWPTVQRNLDALQCGINAFAFIARQDDLKRLVGVLKKHGIRISVECGYFDWEPTQDTFDAPNPKRISDRVRSKLTPGIGRETALIEMAKIAPLLNAGGRPDYIVLDGPVRRLLHPGADTGRTTAHGEQEGLPSIDAAVTEIVAYMRAWLERFPRVRFLPLTNFPNWGWKGDVAYWASGPNGMFWGDYFPVVEALITGIKAAKLRLAGFVIDNPYEYMKGTMPVNAPWPPPTRAPSATDWLARVLDLERYVRGRGVPVSLIVNSQAGGHTSDEAFNKFTLECLRTYHEAGGKPDRYVFQTWYQYPTRLEPETEPTTMTGMLKEAIAIIKGTGRR